jgi:hypothetical protein
MQITAARASYLLITIFVNSDQSYHLGKDLSLVQTKESEQGLGLKTWTLK